MRGGPSRTGRDPSRTGGSRRGAGGVLLVTGRRDPLTPRPRERQAGGGRGRLAAREVTAGRAAGFLRVCETVGKVRVGEEVDRELKRLV